MKHRNEHNREKRVQTTVNELVVWLVLNFAIVWLITIASVFFLLLYLSQFGLVELLAEFGQLTFISMCLVALSIFLIVLTRDFYRLRPWTFDYVEFILTWTTARGLLGYFLERLQQENVRRAFRPTDKLDLKDKA